jgi:hypothetical protein
MRLHVLLPLLLSPVVCFCAAAPAPLRVFQTPPALLLQVKQQSDPAILRAVRAEADTAMRAGPWSVMQKTMLPPSGVRHDYLSLSRYAWPNPSTPNHLPYVLRDGQVNPEIKLVGDHDGIEKTSHTAYALALGWYLTGNPRYAERASLLLHVWFLNPSTRMNPNLNYSGGVPGINGGLGNSVIDARELPFAIDAIGLLADSRAWTPADQTASRAWFTAYFDWLQHSSSGRREAAARNNHAIWYLQQAASIALFLGQDDQAREILHGATTAIATQIMPDGRQPQELARTRPYSYSLFNVVAIARLAELSDAAGVDLWRFTAANGACMRAAIDYLLPYLNGTQKWTGLPAKPEELASMRLPLLLASIHYADPKYQTVARHLGPASAQILLFEAQIPKSVATN